LSYGDVSTIILRGLVFASSSRKTLHVDFFVGGKQRGPAPGLTRQMTPPSNTASHLLATDHLPAECHIRNVFFRGADSLLEKSVWE